MKKIILVILLTAFSFTIISCTQDKGGPIPAGMSRLVLKGTGIFGGKRFVVSPQAFPTNVVSERTVSCFFSCETYFDVPAPGSYIITIPGTPTPPQEPEKPAYIYLFSFSSSGVEKTYNYTDWSFSITVRSF